MLRKEASNRQQGHGFRHLRQRWIIAGHPVSGLALRRRGNPLPLKQPQRQSRATLTLPELTMVRSMSALLQLSQTASDLDMDASKSAFSSMLVRGACAA
jgi:hypothetical protein